MNDKTQELAVQEQPNQAAIVMQSLTSSIETGTLTPESLTLVLDAQERVLDRQAKQEFSVAMANCQAEMPNILKTESNNQTHSKYESLDALNKVISPVYTSNGFSVSFGTDECPLEDMIRVAAEVTHRGGWTKDYHYDLPYDMLGLKGNQNKTKIHASGSTLSYGRRYLLKLIFNLTTVDENDDDGNAAGGDELRDAIYQELQKVFFDRSISLTATILEHSETIHAMKNAFDLDDLTLAAEAWFELTEEQQRSLWVAPSKGGAFTTKEREIIKSSEFRKAHFGESE